jgi:hypothetical protein
VCSFFALSFFCFVLNSESGCVTVAAKYEKDRRGNKKDVAVLKQARCQVTFEEFKKVYEVFEGLGNDHKIISESKCNSFLGLKSTKDLHNLYRRKRLLLPWPGPGLLPDK